MSEFRKRVLEPALIPLGAFAFIGALAYAVSRILLAVTTEGSVVVAILLAGCILFAAAAVAKSGVLKPVQRVSLITFALLLLGGGIAVDASLGPREVEKHLEVLEEPVIAQDIAFHPREIRVPADQPVGVRFENRDAGVQHNIAIFKTPQASENLFRGQLISGVATRVYEFPALPAGAYFFWCDVHPQQMTGTVLAGEAAAPPTAPPTGGPPAPPIDITARNIQFDKTELSFPAGAQVTVDFRNEDPATSHNWALYRDQAFTEAVFNGEIFSGPAERKYVFTAPSEPGTYYFKCDVHPSMRGTVTVT